jgi:hypothetical protein
MNVQKMGIQYGALSHTPECCETKFNAVVEFASE